MATANVGTTGVEAGEIESLLECPICMDTYKKPKVLPCQHSFCLECLHTTYAKKFTENGENQKIVCPVCRQSHSFKILSTCVGRKKKLYVQKKKTTKWTKKDFNILLPNNLMAISLLDVKRKYSKLTDGDVACSSTYDDDDDDDELEKENETNGADEAQSENESDQENDEPELATDDESDDDDDYEEEDDDDDYEEEDDDDDEEVEYEDDDEDELGPEDLYISDDENEPADDNDDEENEQPEVADGDDDEEEEGGEIVFDDDDDGSLHSATDECLHESDLDTEGKDDDDDDDLPEDYITDGENNSD